eukprot:gnl/TRDRNA2_/TRDRNA2_186375_c0_seq1.p1 gnl/TRDRNA2_/TRDRNA2_186375_c0~~gnl/TRDRNA2_/TRDRNA2_186375_c0_seq1.p1  ORF type:complete len:252 (+),score=65.98 gnl/TRDRNA2_/TRDRNA2_186375_c0_seq1:61-756(+)
MQARAGLDGGGGPGGVQPGMEERFVAPEHREELLLLLRDELKAEYKERLYSDARRACEQLDRLRFSALRQLPPHIRAMPVREAFRLASAGAAANANNGVVAPSAAAGPPSGGKRAQDAHTQTNLYQVTTKKLKPLPVGAGATPGSACAGGVTPTANGSTTPSLNGINPHEVDPQMAAQLAELKETMQIGGDFTQILGEVTEDKLAAMPPEQRRTFLHRISSTFDKMYAGGS